MRAQELVERALAADAAGAARGERVVIVRETSSANLRWAGNTLTTNGVTRSRHLTVVALEHVTGGTRVGVISREGVTEDRVAGVVAAAGAAASRGLAADDARPLLHPGDPAACAAEAGDGPAWDAEPSATGIEAFAEFAPALGGAFETAASAGHRLYGYAAHRATSVFLGTSTGLRLRDDDLTGKVELNAKTADAGRSSWAGMPTQDFTDIDIAALAGGLGQRLEWATRRVDLPAGRYDAILPPTAMADLFFYMYWQAGAKDALDGRTVFSKPGGGTRVGERLANLPVSLRGDPAAPGLLRCSPFVVVGAPSRAASVFDNGLTIPATAWLRDGELTALPQTRYTAQLSGLPATPATGNLIMEGPPGSGGSVADVVARTRRGLLLTSLWYIRELDPQQLLLTGLTRDGVYLVENGEVVGEVNNFRFNESPVGMLGRLAEVGASTPALPREWSEYFTRTAMPAARVEGFNMSSVSPAN